MKPGKIIVYNIIYVSAVLDIFASAGKITSTSLKEGKSSVHAIKLLPGIKMILEQDKIFVNVNFQDLFAVVEEKGREGNVEEDGQKKSGIIKKFGKMMMMLPLLMQLLRLPGEIAEIKVSLIRSILVAKMALIMIIFNAIRNMQKSDVVVVHQPQELVHEHYYHEMDYREPEDNDQGWLG